MRLTIEVDIDNPDFLEAGSLSRALEPVLEAAQEVCGALAEALMIVDSGGRACGSWRIEP